MTVKLTADEIREAVKCYVEERLHGHAVKDVKLSAYDSVVDGRKVISAEAELLSAVAPNGPYR